MSPGSEDPELSFGKSLQACDLCHARKVKCDRKRQCQHCTEAGVGCERLRPKQVRRSRRPHTQGRRDNHEATERSGQRSISGHSTSDTSGTGTRVRRKAHSTTATHPPSTTTTTTTTTRPLPAPSDQTDYTGKLIQQELNSRATSLSSDRVWVLESAISFIANDVASSQQADEAEPEPVLAEDAGGMSDKIPPELFYIMFVGNCGRTVAPLHWPDHLPAPLLEQMCVALANDAVTGQAAIQHKVCVFCKATMYMSRLMRFCEPGFWCDALEKSQKSYAAACFQYLRQVDLISHPTLGTLQAVLAGANLAMLLGRTSQAWTLTAMATRILVSLGLHTLTRESLDDPAKFAIRHCVYWCFSMDKTLSMLLVRPSSLSRLPYEPATLVRMADNNPLYHKTRILVRLAQVQEVWLSLLARPSETQAPTVSETVGYLECELHKIHGSILELHDEWIKTPELKLEWDTVSFTLYAVLTAVLRLDTASLHIRSKRDECLLYARNALKVMERFPANVSRNATTDFFSWTVLSYPLTPFFVVFCNVVATSNLQDLELLAKVTSVMSQIKEQCLLSMNLYKLFTHFVHLCGHLNDVQISSSGTVQQATHMVSGHERTPEPPGMSQLHQPLTSSGITSSPESRPTGQPPSTADHQHQQTASAGNAGNPNRIGAESGTVWDDELVWQLFNLQPSIESFDLASFDIDPVNMES